MPLQVQGSDKTKLEVYGSVRVQIKVSEIKVHSSATAGAR